MEKGECVVSMRDGRETRGGGEGVVTGMWGEERPRGRGKTRMVGECRNGGNAVFQTPIKIDRDRSKGSGKRQEA